MPSKALGWLAVNPPSPKIVLASVGDPRAPDTWSGTTLGILSGLTERAVATCALDLELRRGLEQALLAGAAIPTHNRYDAEGAWLTAKVRSARARGLLRGVPLDGAIQIGTGFKLPSDVPYVTLEDMTVRQGTDIHPVFKRMSRRTIEGWERRRARIYAGARMCAVGSRWAAESLVGDYGIPREKVAVVGFGANHLGASGDRDWSIPRFLFVGMDWQRKGGAGVLRAFSRLRQERPDAVLDVVGGHPDIQELGVTSHGVLSRSRERDRTLIGALFARATCLVMPSEVEPFGIVHVEAASAGVPSIGTSVGGPKDVIGEGCGLLVQPADEEALLNAMRRMADAGTARRMGQTARERSRLYTWTHVAERLMRALGFAALDGRPLAEFL
jgi:glycosyltransferase involved in cell wall biosynthesis